MGLEKSEADRVCGASNRKNEKRKGLPLEWVQHVMQWDLCTRGWFLRSEHWMIEGVKRESEKYDFSPAKADRNSLVTWIACRSVMKWWWSCGVGCV
jgi:hypothetical protein